MSNCRTTTIIMLLYTQELERLTCSSEKWFCLCACVKREFSEQVFCIWNKWHHLCIGSRIKFQGWPTTVIWTTLYNWGNVLYLHSFSLFNIILQLDYFENFDFVLIHLSLCIVEYYKQIERFFTILPSIFIHTKTQV